MCTETCLVVLPCRQQLRADLLLTMIGGMHHVVRCTRAIFTESLLIPIFLRPSRKPTRRRAVQRELLAVGSHKRTACLLPAPQRTAVDIQMILTRYGVVLAAGGGHLRVVVVVRCVTAAEFPFVYVARAVGTMT
jgi:hypothetical protein